MTEEVFNAYRDDGWYIFELYHTADGKGNAVKGLYGTPFGWTGKGENPKQYRYKPDAVYGGVPPEDIVVIDWDVKKNKKGLESLNKLKGDLDFNLETCVKSPSGGGHVYARLSGLPDDLPRLKQTQDEYLDVDFQGHGSEFVVLGGQEIDGYGTYSFADDTFDYFVNEGIDWFKAGELELRAPSSEEQSSYDDIDEDEHALTRGDPDDFRKKVFDVDPDCDRDTWVTVLRCINSFYLGDKTGEALAVEWSKSAEVYADEDSDDITRAYHGNVATTPEFYNKIITLSNRVATDLFESVITKADSIEGFEEVAKAISARPIKNDKRAELAKSIAKRAKEVGVDSRLRNVHWEKKCKYSDPEQVKREAEMMDGIHIYAKQNEFLLRKGNVLVVGLSRAGLGTHCRIYGLNKDAVDLLIDSATLISKYEKVSDYTMDDGLRFELRESEAKEDASVLTLVVNPLFSLPEKVINGAIVNDFCNTIWQGKVDDIVRIVAYSIRFKQRKLNRLMVVAPSDFGKSEIFKLMDFQDINMTRLISAMDGVKGVGEGIIKGIRRSGLMLIDEANTTIPQQIKELDATVQIDQFGSGGTQIIPLHFTALTSTHKTATRTNSDELYNRFLQIELSKGESPYTLTKSPIFREDSEHYTDVVRSYLKHSFREALLDPDVTEQDLFDLQDKYRLPENNDLHEILHEISIDVIEYIKANVREGGDIINYNGTYMFKRKGDLRLFIEERLSAVDNLDVGKYSEMLYDHFMPESKAKSVKVDGRPMKYYVVRLKSLTENDEQAIIDEFDDLDLEDL